MIMRTISSFSGIYAGFWRSKRRTEEMRKMGHKSKFICKNPMESLFFLGNMTELLRNLTERTAHAAPPG